MSRTFDVVETDLSRDLQETDIWSDELVGRSNVRVHDVPIVSVGGGMGGFITCDYLRVLGGLSTNDIRVVSNLRRPWQTYEYLTRVSQLGRGKRIRSDSGSRPDNLWGFPSYAVQEAFRERTFKPLWQVLVEPLLMEYYTPVLDNVLSGIEREAQRIGYWDMLTEGQARMVRRRAGGGYFTLVAPRADNGDPDELIAYRSRDVHVAVGYSGLNYLPELQEFREDSNDYHHVVNGYENHEHVYQAARRRKSVILVRGGGIVTCAVLQRIIHDRECLGLDTEVVQLFRNFVDGTHGPHPWARRRGGSGFAYQGFNYPKAVWGGQVKSQMRQTEGPDRVELYDEISGTTTPMRQLWQFHLRRARKAGWYRPISGAVESMRLVDGKVHSSIASESGTSEVVADYVIDCTGLEGEVAEHEVLADLLAHGGARRNPLGRLDVGPEFVLRGADSGMGRIYASGAAAYGGYFPGVDTFLGLQIAAQEIVDDIANRGWANKVGTVGSISQWVKWVRGRTV